MRYKSSITPLPGMMAGDSYGVKAKTFYLTHHQQQIISSRAAELLFYVVMCN
jgi:hypothetical protein